MADAARALAVLTSLASLGVGLSIDDYGTGYSSLACIKRLPVDEIKLDGSFVRHLAEDDSDAAIVASTVGLAHSLGLQVVAEGVETQHALELLRAMGCDVAQGYAPSKPLPPAALERCLCKRARGQRRLVARSHARASWVFGQASGHDDGARPLYGGQRRRRHSAGQPGRLVAGGDHADAEHPHQQRHTRQ